MGLTREQLRVVTEDVGGAFGMKTPPYPEHPALLVAAKITGRPVHWMASRSEACLSDNQARDMDIEGTLALDAKGKFLALRLRNLVDLGGFMEWSRRICRPTISSAAFRRCIEFR